MDIKKFGILLLPPPLRKKRMVAWLKVLLLPLVELEQEFTDYRADAYRRLSTNGQVVYMEKALNDYFLLPRNDIRVSDNVIDPLDLDTFVFDGEEPETYFFDNENTDVTYLKDGSVDQTSTFVVNVPSYLEDRVDEIRNIVEFNKPAGRRFIIELYDL